MRFFTRNIVWEFQLIVEFQKSNFATIAKARIEDWRELARDLLLALRLLEDASKQEVVRVIGQSVLLSIAHDLHSIRLEWCRPNGEKYYLPNQIIELNFDELPIQTDKKRDDGVATPNSSIDRAVCKLAADMLSWTKNPQTFELITHRRFFLFICWHGDEPKIVNEYEYGLWDE